jgi:hypothetical protein
MTEDVAGPSSGTSAWNVGIGGTSGEIEFWSNGVVGDAALGAADEAESLMV